MLPVDLQKPTFRKALDHSLLDFDPDAYDQPAVALRLLVEHNGIEQPVHSHRKGQLILALRGGVTCHVAGAIWMVPPQHAMWIPGGLSHSNRATDNARIELLFVEPNAAALPQTCCTFIISPLLRELIGHLADQHPDYPPDSPVSRLVGVLLEQLVAMPVARLQLPISAHPRIRRMADALAAHPDNRSTLAEWAAQLAMSERSLARLVERETGLTFGRWRQQLHLIVALRQLAAGDTVQQVAGMLGYDSVTAFITMFKKALGQSPSRYFVALYRS